MRIAIMAGSIPSTTFIDALVNGMAEQGYTMVVIGKRRSNYQYNPGVECLEVPQQKIAQLFFVLRLLRYASWAQLRSIYAAANSFQQFFYDLLFYLPIFKSQPDRVHIQWAATLYNRALLFDLFPHKILLSLRGAHINYTPIIKPEIGEYYKQVFPRVHKFHAVSKAMALVAKSLGADEDRIQTIYTCINDDILQSPITAKKEQSALQLIAVGRFHWVKGYQILMDALGALKERGMAFKLLLIAEGEIPEEINYAIHQYNMHENITIIGKLSHQAVIKHLEESDLLLLPSVNEGIANVVVEAMAVGTPVLSSNCGGMTEVIENGVNGLLFENRNSKHLAEQLVVFSALNWEVRFAMARKAKATVQLNFTRDRMLNQYKHFYS